MTDLCISGPVPLDLPTPSIVSTAVRQCAGQSSTVAITTGEAANAEQYEPGQIDILLTLPGA